MRTWLTTLLLSVLLLGCSSQPQRTLSDVASTRVYAADKQQVFDAVRLHCVKEDFKVDRFEQESGSIISHKLYGESGLKSEYGGDADRLIVMHVRIRELAPGRTETVTSFTYGKGKVAANREDESILLDNYSALFSTLDSQLGPPRQEKH